MPVKHERPDFVLRFNRPPGTEIKCINGNWYLYERKGFYDPIKKRNHKVSGALLGKITPEGFKPRTIKISAVDVREIQCVEYGASYYLYHTNQHIIERLKEYFPRMWQKLFVMAVLRCLGETNLKNISYAYETSWLSILFNDLHMSPAQLENDMYSLGINRDSICEYMRGELEGYGGFLIVDGHRLISEPKETPYEQLCYDSMRLFSHQTNVLYLFGRNSTGCMPLYYKQSDCSLLDCAVLPDIQKESGIAGNNITIIVDERFGSTDDFSPITDGDTKYIISLKKDTQEVDEIPPGHIRYYENAFNYQDHSILCNIFDKGEHKVYLYYDMHLAVQETSYAVERLEKRNKQNAEDVKKGEEARKKGKPKLTDKELEAKKPVDVAKFVQDNRDVGILIIKTNRLDLSCAQVYALYKMRQEFEESFKCFDDTLDAESSCMNDEDKFEGWLFVNHLALQMLFRVLNHAAELDLTSERSFKNIIKTLMGVRANNIAGKWYVTKLSQKANELCKELGVDFETSPTAVSAKLKP